MTPSILYLIDVMTRRGGTEVHLTELSTRLSARGFNPIVCNLAGDEAALRQLAELGVETWARPIVRLYAPEGRRMMRRVIREARERNVQIVQTFHFKSDWMGINVSRALGCSLVSSRRDLGFQRTRLRGIAYRFISPRADAFIAPSQAVANATMAIDRVPPERMHVIYNGLDRARFAAPQDRAECRAWLGLPPEGPVIGMVSGLRTIKDHPTLFRAMACLADRRPRIHLAIVGEGDAEASLRAMVRELGLEKRVTFTGARLDIPRALAAMDIFVLSTHSEGMSNAIIEAMASGLPVVASDVGGNAECVVHGETGFIVPEASVDALAARMDELLSDPEMARRMGEAGRARTAELFDVDAMVSHTVDLYRSLGAGR
ncbi:MAG TPA: glycosyltransferase [Armatimonadota bacterium]|jgi:glycosyltransferase involved in cell wall biosynthesis